MSTNKQTPYYELRCLSCDKLLAKEGKSNGRLEIKCRRCGTLNSVMEEMEEQVIVTDAEGKILYVNSSLEKITGYSIKEVIGKTPGVWGGLMSDKFYEQMWKVIKDDKRALSTTVTNKRKDGKTYKALLKISPITNGEDEVIMFVGIETPLRG